MQDSPDLLSENEVLRERLEQAEAVLTAVRSGEVDALMIGAPGSKQVYTLASAETPYRAFVEAMHEGAATVDAGGCILYANEALARLLGRPLKNVIGSRVREAAVPEDRDGLEALLQSGKGIGAQRSMEFLCADGSSIPALVTVGPLLGEGGRIAVVVTDLREHERGASARALLEQSERSRRALLSLLEDQTRAEQTLRKSNRALKTLSAGNEALVRATDEVGLLNEMVRIICEIGGYPIAFIGYAVEDDAKSIAWRASCGGFDPGAQQPAVSWGDNECGQAVSARAIRLGETQLARDMPAHPGLAPWRGTLCATGSGMALGLPLRLAPGERPFGSLSIASRENAFDADETKLLEELAGDLGYGIANLRADAERRVAESKLEYLAYYDPVTGLANRAKFLERLEEILRIAAGEGREVAVLQVDIERFRTINETFGRAVGDELLMQVAERAMRHLGDSSGPARLGADHFACVVPVASGHDILTQRLEHAYQEIFGAPFRLGDAELWVSAKMGAILFPADGADADTLLSGAEAALNRAKSSGERIQFFTREMTERVAENLALENKLRRALEKDEFVLHYQPKVSLDSGAIAGIEALIRWQSPDLGLVPPFKFIGLLEETGLILEVGAWALKQACADHRRWVAAGLKPPRVAVNVSSIQLRQQDFVRRVEEAIKGDAHVGIDLEITESVIMQDVGVVIDKLKKIGALGLKIAIDDFGTGYSSLAYLARLPVETLKIDRAFISAMLDDPNATTLVQTMITMAHSLRLKVVAEGVETEEQAKMLRLLRCDEMQGYLFSKPVPAAVLASMLGEAAVRNAGNTPEVNS